MKCKVGDLAKINPAMYSTFPFWDMKIYESKEDEIFVVLGDFGADVFAIGQSDGKKRRLRKEHLIVVSPHALRPKP